MQFYSVLAVCAFFAATAMGAVRPNTQDSQPSVPQNPAKEATEQQPTNQKCSCKGISHEGTYCGHCKSGVTVTGAAETDLVWCNLSGTCEIRGTGDLCALYKGACDGNDA